MDTVLVENDAQGYALFENDDGHLRLEVLCGGIGMYVAKIILSDEEIRVFRERGSEFVEKLAYDVSTDSAKYKPRMVP
jgi:hypothetical protein